MQFKLILLSTISVLCFHDVKPADRVEMFGKTYLVSHPLKYNWHNAVAYCRYQNMFLIDLPTQVDYDNLKSVLKSLGEPQNNSAFWTSASDLGLEGNFLWMSTGHPLVYPNWGSGEPNNNGGNEHCVLIRADSMLNDGKCSDVLPFICRNESTTITDNQGAITPFPYWRK